MRSRTEHKARRRSAAVVLAVVGIAGLGIASAAQLNLTSAPLGAGTQIVATCQGAGTITVSFPTTWNTTVLPATYRVTSVTLAGVHADCGTKPYEIQLLDVSGVAIGGPITGTVPVGGGTFTTATVAAANQQRAQDLGGVAIIIQG
jgi:hypothetical protein